MPLGVAGPMYHGIFLYWWHEIAPALAAGNTVVLKPAETTSLTALKLAEIIQEAGLPPGVVNIVMVWRYGSSGVNHPDINKVAGSTGVGKIIQNAISGTKKKQRLNWEESRQISFLQMLQLIKQ